MSATHRRTRARTKAQAAPLRRELFTFCWSSCLNEHAFDQIYSIEKLYLIKTLRAAKRNSLGVSAKVPQLVWRVAYGDRPLLDARSQSPHGDLVDVIANAARWRSGRQSWDPWRAERADRARLVEEATMSSSASYRRQSGCTVSG